MENKKELELRKLHHDYRRIVEFRAEEDAENNGQYVVTGTPVIFDQKYELFEYNGKKVYEIISSGAFENADYRDVPLKYNHNDTRGVPARTTAKSDQGRLYINVLPDRVDMRANLLPTSGGKDLYLEIKSGTVPQMSWAFTEDRTQEEVIETADEITFIVKKVLRVFDVSAVDFGANPNTSIYARRLGELDERTRLLDEQRRIAKAKALLIKTKL